MRFSRNWLNEFIDISENSKLLYKQFTMLGMEVNSITSIYCMFSNIIVGEIFNVCCLSNKDGIYLVKVFVGNDFFLNVISKKFSFVIGMKVAIATIESILPNSLYIKRQVFKNFISDGIICSYHVLGIEYNNFNIIILPNYVKAGKDILNYFDFKDKIIDISINYNRSDCQNMLGLARELSVLSFRNIKEFDILTKININNSSCLPITVEDNYLSPIYLGRIIKNININNIIPIWMSERLRRSDIVLVNSVVDIINYVFLEFGLFVNVFDLDFIDGRINIRLNKLGEKIILIDNSDFILNDTNILVVGDNNKIIEIAGFSNSKYCVLGKKTKNLFLECALFSSKIINNFIINNKIKTNFIRYNSKNTDFSFFRRVIDRVTYFILSICGGEAGSIIDVSDLNFLPKKYYIKLNYKKINLFIGHKISYKFIIKTLEFIGCILDINDDILNVYPPYWRSDLLTEEDLIEEIIRFYGYDKIPDIPILGNNILKTFSSNLSIDRVKTLLVDKGYHEVITYGFVDNDLQTLLYPKINGLSVLNPFSLEKSVMRLSLFTGLLTVLQYNVNRQQSDISIFEFGVCFLPKLTTDFIVKERLLLSALLSGTKYNEYWDMLSVNVDFYDLKGTIESVLSLFYDLNLINFKAKEYSFLHPGKSASIYYKNIYIGCIGVIHPLIAKYLVFDKPVILFELIWNRLLAASFFNFNEISVFPVNRRDISLLVDDNIYVMDIINICKKVIGKLLVNIYLFDVYYGNSIPKGYKSISIAIFLQSFNKTLEDYEISIIIDKCVCYLQNRFNIKLRY
ncbi:phenylalanine--tRNA ligase subunit beta [Candidatus Purcelliella pentastirinorum]|uniref:phenylalanine--tRNA ligase subunit beta n=1 Tax=Candidatus Purcelliella pentastirinorum TaxID=472834 RepID=UPI002368CF0D|nr:phenylalanine--tRNA ligase subunit beta [Candidatus Purcelliella pentastirinorum]WDI78885.1 phenylalanine--tRNA ligase subunit beta [Candidatus Purcelliella pentastirinorum]WDR80019.1 phenylalanine--tRNA ligase subunit beta [Candidatus Purcelliella pentastirinorum]